MALPSFDDITKGADVANSLVNKYIVAPASALGIAGFIFSVEKETKVQLDCDITDHYVENNSARQDHIALKPERLTLSGYIGEVVNEVQKSETTLQTLTKKLTVINSYLPILTGAARQLKTNLFSQKTSPTDYLDASINSGVTLYQTFKQLNPPPTKQAQAFNFFRALKNARQLVSVTTPYTFYVNMAIESISFIQPEDSNGYSDVMVTLKEFRTVQTQFVNFDFSKYQGRGVSQRAEEQIKGKAQGIKGDNQSMLLKLKNLIF